MVQKKIWWALELSYEDIRPLLSQGTSFTQDLPLLGEGSSFDSIAIVAFCSAIEDRLGEQTDREIRIISDHAFSRHNSPFKSMQSLAAYIEELLATQASGPKS